MTADALLQVGLICALLFALSWPLGLYMAKVFTGERTLADRMLALPERWLYRGAGVNPAKPQDWRAYMAAMLAFNGAGFALLFALLMTQHLLPLNPAGLPGLSWHLAFNTAVSFTTNTNWQSYGGETTMSLFSQMAGLAVQNFVSAATGIAIAVALARGIRRGSTVSLGNFWQDLTRSTLYVLLPLSFIAALVLAASGVPQSFDAAVSATTLEGAQQTIALGPVASQIAIKQIGSNGGGFFNVNSAHPFENPTEFTNLICTLALLVLAAGLVVTFGRLIGDRRHALAIYIAMAVMLAAGLGACLWAESAANPLLTAAGIEGAPGNLEGKEARFGVPLSVVWAVFTTAASNGSVNAMHDSFTALGGMVPLINMLLGEVIFGGVGAGLYGMVIFVILAVFIAGLMVGRTPEYQGKKIEAKEMVLAVLIILVMPAFVLGFSALSLVHPLGLAGLQEAGPHGLSEMLYAYTSATANNGSAFAGLTANSPWHNTLLGIAMLAGRFAVIVPTLAIAGALAVKTAVPPSPGSFPTHGGMFVGLLIAVILIVGGLTFFPVLVLGPIAEHGALIAGQTF